MNKDKIKVYIASPLSKGDVALNVHLTIGIGDILYDAGFYPYIPHLTHFWNLLFPRPYDDWLELDKEYLKVCDTMYYIEGESSGANEEVTLANELGIPIFTSITSIIEWKVRVRNAHN